jgi:hypothetical protein
MMHGSGSRFPRLSDSLMAPGTDPPAAWTWIEGGDGWQLCSPRRHLSCTPRGFKAPGWREQQNACYPHVSAGNVTQEGFAGEASNGAREHAGSRLRSGHVLHPRVRQNNDRNSLTVSGAHNGGGQSPVAFENTDSRIIVTVPQRLCISNLINRYRFRNEVLDEDRDV